MQVPRREDITGLVLAGGAARRMGGRDKGWIEFRGRPLVEHVIARMRPQVATLMISANRSLERYRALGLPVLVDDDGGVEPFPGPLAGWLTALRACKTPWIACAPCDAPFLDLSLVARLADSLGASRAAAAYVGERMEPMFCLLHVDLVDELAQALGHGQRCAEAWLRGVGAAPAEFLHSPAFTNVNSIDDLRAHEEAR